LSVAERIRSAIVALDVPHVDAAECVASVSIGVAGIVPRGLDDPTSLIDLADAALYAAKRAGRNRSAVAPIAAATAIARADAGHARPINNASVPGHRSSAAALRLIRELDADTGIRIAEVLPPRIGQIGQQRFAHDPDN
jgi:hypothetical protein